LMLRRNDEVIIKSMDETKAAGTDA